MHAYTLNIHMCTLSPVNTSTMNKHHVHALIPTPNTESTVLINCVICLNTKCTLSRAVPVPPAPLPFPKKKKDKASGGDGGEGRNLVCETPRATQPTSGVNWDLFTFAACSEGGWLLVGEGEGERENVCTLCYFVKQSEMWEVDGRFFFIISSLSWTVWWLFLIDVGTQPF